MMQNAGAMPPENPALVGAMEAVGFEDTTENRQALYNALHDAMLIMGTTGDPAAEGWVTFQPGDNVEIVTFQTQDGRTIWPVFTDMGQMQTGRLKADRYLAIMGFDLLQMAWQYHIDIIHINPGGMPTTLVHDWEIADLARGSIPEPASEGADVVELDEETHALVTPPDPPLSPSELNFVGQVVSEYDRVNAAYVFMLELPGEGGPILTVGVVYGEVPDPETEHAMVNDILGTLAPELGQQMSFLRLDAKLLEAIGDYAPLVYKRE